MNATRRQLQFTKFDDVRAELQSLQAAGYTATGKWNLSQVCGHLHDWMRFSLDGYPHAAPPMRLMLWLMKLTIGKRQLHTILESGFKDGIPTLGSTVPAADAATDADSVQQLLETMDRFENSTSPIHPSPLMGPLTREQATRLQLAHCEHHLSFLEPKLNPS